MYVHYYSNSIIGIVTLLTVRKIMTNKCNMNLKNIVYKYKANSYLYFNFIMSLLYFEVLHDRLLVYLNVLNDQYTHRYLRAIMFICTCFFCMMLNFMAYKLINYLVIYCILTISSAMRLQEVFIFIDCTFF